MRPPRTVTRSLFRSICCFPAERQGRRRGIETQIGHRRQSWRKTRINGRKARCVCRWLKRGAPRTQGCVHRETATLSPDGKKLGISQGSSDLETSKPGAGRHGAIVMPPYPEDEGLSLIAASMVSWSFAKILPYPPERGRRGSKR